MSKPKVYSRLSDIPSGSASDSVTPGCLVLEGGAFRGLYNQGALDALMIHSLNIHTVVGVSAGALAGVNYVSGQIGRPARINLTFRHDSRYIGRKALKNSHSLLDLDFLLKTCDEELEPFDHERFRRGDRRFVAVATNCLTGEAVYYDRDNCSDVFDAVKASASMPFITPMVDIDGIPCLDGGCACKIGYQWALDQGFEKIMVIKTRERGFRKQAKPDKAALRLYRHYPDFARVLSRSNEDYNRQCDELDQLEASGRLYVLAPSKPVTVGRLERDMEKLGDLYWLGYKDAENRIEEIRRYLLT